MTGAATAVGTHTARATELTGDDAANYRLSAARTKDFTITKSALPGAALTIGSWTYGDEAKEPSVSGNIEGANVTYTYKKANAEDSTYSRKVPTAAGSYTVRAEIAATAGYESKTLTQNFTIAEKTASLQWENTSLKYTGQPQKPTAKVINLEKGDDVSVVVTGEQTNASNTAYTATAASLSGSDAENYKLPDEKTANFTIGQETLIPTVTIAGWTYGDTPSEPEVSGNTENGTVTYTWYKETDKLNSKPTDAGTYRLVAVIGKTANFDGGQASCEFTIAKKTASLAWSDISLTYNAAAQSPKAVVANKVGTDEVNVTITGENTGAGEYIASATDLTGAAKDNYKLPDSSAQTYIIAKAELTVTAEDKNVTLGASAPEYTAKYAGFKGEDSASDLTGTLAFDCDYTAESKAGTYDITPKGVSSDNYDITFVKGTLTVGTGEARITTDPSAMALTYNGTLQELVTAGAREHGTIYYRVNGGKWQNSVPFAKNAGKYTVSWYLKADESYVSTSSSSEPAGEVDVTIARKTVGLTWANTSFKYDGKDHIPSASLSNIESGDTVNVVVTGAATAVGTHTASATRLTGASAENYRLPEDGTEQQTFTIDKSDLTDNSTSVTISGWTYGDDANEPTVEGNLEGANVTYRYKKYDEEDSAYTTKTPKAAGKYIVQATIAATAGYNAKVLTKEFDIAPRVADLDWTDTSLLYRQGVEQAPKAEVGNLVAGDKCTVTVEGKVEAAGSYQATATALSNSNYALPTTVTQPFTISAGTLVPTVTITGWTYGDSANTPVVNGNTGSGTETFKYKVKDADDSTYTEAVPTEAGTYTVKANIAASGSYDAAEAYADFTIERKTAGLAWKNISFTYDGEEHVPAATVTNPVGSDNLTVTVSGKQKETGEYVATATAIEGDHASNYKLPETVTQVFTISDRDESSSVSVAIDNWTYGDTRKEPVLNGYTGTGEVTWTYKKAGAQDSTYGAYDDVVKGQAGSYTVKGSVPKSGSYSAVTATETFTIHQKVAELSWSPDNFSYTGSDQKPAATVSNLEEGDTCTVTVTGAATATGEHTATATKLSNDNYKLPADPTFTFTIGKSALDSAAVTIANWTYGDDPSVPEVSGNTDGAQVSFSYKEKDAADDTYTTKVPSMPGEYTVRAVIAATQGHIETTVTDDFSISLRTVNVTWSDTSFIYDGKEHIPSAEITNIVRGDDLGFVLEGGKINANAEGESYTAAMTKLTGKDADLYVLPDPAPSQTFTIGKKSLIPTVAIGNWTYGDDPDTPVVSGNEGEADVTLLYAPAGTTDESAYSETMPKDAGTYTLKAVLAETENFKGASAATDFTISQRTASLRWKNIYLTYSGKAQKPEAEVANLVSGDECIVTVSGEQTDPGSYTATAESLSNANYKLPPVVTQSFVISQASSGGGGGGSTPEPEIGGDAGTVSKDIEKLPDDISLSDKDAVEKAKEEYDSLSDEEKAKIDPKTVEKLNDAVDTIAAETVKDEIVSLPDEITESDTDAVKKALDDYSRLTDAQKAKLDPDTVRRITDAEKAIRTWQTGEDGTALGSGASWEAAEKAILGMTSDADPAGSRIVPLKAKSTKQTKKSVKVNWNKTSGAVKYVVYGNKCGKKNKMKRLKITTKSSINFKKIAGKKVKKGTYYKFIVVALGKDNNVVSTSKVVHIASKGGKNGNYSKLTIKTPKKSKAVLTAGKTLQIRAKLTKAKKVKVRKHIGLRYESSDTSVATVSKKGKVTAVSAGTAKITVYTQNGLSKTVTITVK